VTVIGSVTPGVSTLAAALAWSGGRRRPDHRRAAAERGWSGQPAGGRGQPAHAGAADRHHPRAPGRRRGRQPPRGERGGQCRDLAARPRARDRPGERRRPGRRAGVRAPTRPTGGAAARARPRVPRGPRHLSRRVPGRAGKADPERLPRRGGDPAAARVQLPVHRPGVRAGDRRLPGAARPMAAHPDCGPRRSGPAPARRRRGGRGRRGGVGRLPPAPAAPGPGRLDPRADLRRRGPGPAGPAHRRDHRGRRVSQATAVRALRPGGGLVVAAAGHTDRRPLGGAAHARGGARPHRPRGGRGDGARARRLPADAPAGAACPRRRRRRDPASGSPCSPTSAPSH
jgi:hypothetical protein